MITKVYKLHLFFILASVYNHSSLARSPGDCTHAHSQHTLIMPCRFTHARTHARTHAHAHTQTVCIANAVLIFSALMLTDRVFLLHTVAVRHAELK